MWKAIRVIYDLLFLSLTLGKDSKVDWSPKGLTAMGHGT